MEAESVSVLFYTISSVPKTVPGSPCLLYATHKKQYAFSKLKTPISSRNWVLSKFSNGSQNVVPRLAAQASSGNLLEIQVLWPFHKFTESEPLGLGSWSIYFNKPSVWVRGRLKFDIYQFNPMKETLSRTQLWLAAAVPNPINSAILVQKIHTYLGMSLWKMTLCTE